MNILFFVPLFDSLIGLPHLKCTEMPDCVLLSCMSLHEAVNNVSTAAVQVSTKVMFLSSMQINRQ